MCLFKDNSSMGIEELSLKRQHRQVKRRGTELVSMNLMVNKLSKPT